MSCSAATFSAAELLNVTGGKTVNRIEPDGEYAVATDNRIDCSNAVFIAIKGELFDPHDSLDRAVEHGAAALLIEKRAAGRVRPEWRIPVITVDDTLHAYWQLAHFHRMRFPRLKVAALTGSVGKTSVKEMTRAICSAACADPDREVLATIGNTNNHFGVPANLLRLTPLHRYAIIEIGTSSPGEIAPLAAMAAPDAAAVNSIAACHLEKLGSLDGVAEEKGSIFTALPPDGTAVFPVGCHGADILKKYAAERKTLRFGEKGDVAGRYLGGNLTGSAIELEWRDGEKFHIDWTLSGPHQAANAGCAAALGSALGIDRAAIAKGLSAARLPGMRMLVRRFNSADWVVDAYNANPESMAAALEWLSEFTIPEKFLAVLGDMRELGDFEAAGHLGVLKKLAERFPGSAAVLVGEHMAAAAAQIPRKDKAAWRTFNTAAAAKDAVAEMAEAGFTVLIKASRGTALEKALPEGVLAE